MQTGTIINKTAGKLIPDQFVRVCLAKNRSIMSCAVVMKDGDGKPELVIDGVENPTFDQFQQAQNEVKAHSTLFYLGNSLDGKISEESIQPFEILSDGQKNPLLIAFTDGDFSNYGEVQSVHSADFFAVQKFYRPKIEKLYRLLGNDLEKLFQELDDQVTRQEIINSFAGRGSLVLMGANGKILTYGQKNPDWMNYDWGWTTNSYGYKEEQKKEETATSVPVVSKKRRIIGLAAPKEDTEAAVVNTEQVNDVEPQVSSKSPEPTAEPSSGVVSRKKQEDPAPKPDASDAPKAEEQESSEPLITIIKSPPMGELKSKNEKKRWYDSNWPGVGPRVPQNFKNLPPIKHKVPSSELAAWLEKGWKVDGAPGNVKVAANGKKEQGYPERTEAPKATAEPRKSDVAPKHIPAQSSSGYRAFEEKAEKVVQKTEDSAVQDWILKAVDKKFISFGSGEIPLDPKLIQSAEVAVPTATEKAGLDGIHSTFGWSRDALAECQKKHPDWFLDLFCQYRLAYIKTLKEEDRPSTTSHVKEPEAKSDTSMVNNGIVRRKKVA